MKTKLQNLFMAALTLAASTQKLGVNLIRVAILVIFVWIGGLKFWNYEAEGIVPFVANSPFMSFFYTKSAPEYKEYKLKEGEFNEAKHQWHVENNTYGFSHGLGILIMAIGILTFLGIFSPKIGLAGAALATKGRRRRPFSRRKAHTRARTWGVTPSDSCTIQARGHFSR